VTFSALYLMVGLVAGQRLGELWLASRNTRRLKAAGAVEIGARHYPLFVLLHASWLIAIAILIPPFTPPNLWLIALFLMLQLGRVWVISSLGPYWSTRIIHVPGAQLVRKGPFRFVRHPNYLIVAGEVAVLPLAFKAYWIAAIFSLLSALLTLHRIRVEEGGLSDRPGWQG
jgi:methyltransferase